MNKTINFLATLTLSILVMEFCVLKSKPVAAEAYNDFVSAELDRKGALADYRADNSETDRDVTVEDELEKEAPYNDSADTEEFYEHGASGDDETNNSEVNRDREENNEGLNSEDTEVDEELEREAGSFE